MITFWISAFEFSRISAHFSLSNDEEVLFGYAVAGNMENGKNQQRLGPYDSYKEFTFLTFP